MGRSSCIVRGGPHCSPRILRRVKPTEKKTQRACRAEIGRCCREPTLQPPQAGKSKKLMLLREWGPADNSFWAQRYCWWNSGLCYCERINAGCFKPPSTVGSCHRKLIRKNLENLHAYSLDLPVPHRKDSDRIYLECCLVIRMF